MNKLLGFSLLLCLGATIVSIVSTAIPYWIYQDDTIQGQEVTTSIGLWKSCVKYTGALSVANDCFNVKNAQDWWKAVQALMILGILFPALSTVLGFLYSRDDSKQSLLQCAIFTALLGGVVLIIAVIVFGAKEHQVSSSFSWGFYLALVAGADSLTAAGLMWISKRIRGGYSSI